MLPIPFIQPTLFVVFGNAGEGGVLPKVFQAVEDAADEHALAQGVGKGLHEVPTQPVHVVNAVVAHSKLQSKEERGATEEQTVTLL